VEHDHAAAQFELVRRYRLAGGFEFGGRVALGNAWQRGGGVNFSASARTAKRVVAVMSPVICSNIVSASV
jgi:hypothetical protein